MSNAGQPAADVNQTTVLRFMELVDAKELDRLEEVVAPDVKFHLGNSLLDLDELRGLITSVHEAFPDFTHSVEEIHTVGNDRVVMRATDRATHQGEFEGIAPTGRQIEVGQIAIYQIVDGRIVEVWEQFDFHGLLEQLQE